MNFPGKRFSRKQDQATGTIPPTQAPVFDDLLIVHSNSTDAQIVEARTHQFRLFGFTVAQAPISAYSSGLIGRSKVVYFLNIETDYPIGTHLEDLLKLNKTVLFEHNGLVENADGAEVYRFNESDDTFPGFAQSIRESLAPSIIFFLPSFSISGGLIVALNHAVILQEAGWDVSLADCTAGVGLTTYSYKGHAFPLMMPSSEAFGPIDLMSGYADIVVATMWNTLATARNYPSKGAVCYLVQEYEPGLYEESSEFYWQASATYTCPDVHYFTISRWCERWLAERYFKQAVYIPNGIDDDMFLPHRRNMDKPIRLLIEGDCSSKRKNIDEAFHIVETLPKQEYEIWYLSYGSETKDWYQIDRQYHSVPHDEVGKIYEQCDILLKTSTQEAFSYPPLEMMATGGYVVAARNDGNVEYLVSDDNCLLYLPGDLEEAKRCIDRIANDNNLRAHLYENGISTANSRHYSLIQNEILNAYVKLR